MCPNSPIIDPNLLAKQARKERLINAAKITFWGLLAFSPLAVLHYVW